MKTEWGPWAFASSYVRLLVNRCVVRAGVMINAARGWTQEGGLIDAFVYPITTPVVTFFMESKTYLETNTL
jgi:hypothetical protein